MSTIIGKILVSLLVAAPVSDAAPDLEVVFALGAACEANREAFGFGSILMTQFSGIARADVDAENIDWKSKSAFDHEYYFDKNDGLFKQIDKKYKVNPYTNTVNTYLLTNKIYTLEQAFHYDKSSNMTQHGNLIEGDSAFDSALVCPLRLGSKRPSNFDLASDVASLRRGSAKLGRVDLNASTDGRRTASVEFRFDGFTRIYKIDAERGLPLLIETKTNGATQSFLKYKKVEYVGNRAWFPFQEIVHFKKDGVTKVVDVRSADFDRAPPRSTFRLNFPRPAALIDPIRLVRYSERASWALDELPAEDSPEVRRISWAPARPVVPLLPDAREAAEATTPISIQIILGIGILIIAAVAVAIYFKQGS